MLLNIYTHVPFRSERKSSINTIHAMMAPNPCAMFNLLCYTRFLPLCLYYLHTLQVS